MLNRQPSPAVPRMSAHGTFADILSSAAIAQQAEQARQTALAQRRKAQRANKREGIALGLVLAVAALSSCATTTPLTAQHDQRLERANPSVAFTDSLRAE